MLFGRSTEIEMIRSFMTGARGADRVLVFGGDPGVGKSALLDVGADLATHAGRRVLRAAGVQFEADLQFGTLNQLLHNVIELIGELGGEHRRALDVVLGAESGPAPAPLIVGGATVALLRRAALDAGAGLALVVDDAQWIDQASRMALRYTMRRLGDADIRGLTAARLVSGNGFADDGYRIHDLAPLDEDSSDELLAAVYPALPVTARRRLCADARGNPLALLELPAALDIHRAPARVPEFPPLTRRLQSLFGSRVQTLPERTRHALLLVVLAGDASGRIALEDYLPTPEGRADLAAAERARVLVRNPRTQRLEFRHPLIRSAVVELSTGEERLAAHRRLADTFTQWPQRRAWHLGQAADTPDEEVASLLEAVSLQMFRDGSDHSRVVASMLRAAELSPAATDRARRSVRAAHLGQAITGELEQTMRLLRNNSGIATQGKSLMAALTACYHLLSNAGDGVVGVRLLLAAFGQLGETVGADLELDVSEAMYQLLFTAHYCRRDDLWSEAEAVLGRLAEHQSGLFALNRTCLASVLPFDQQVFDELDRAEGELRWTSDPNRITRVAIAGVCLDRVDGVGEPLRRVIADCQADGAITRVIDAQCLLALHTFVGSQWDEASEVADEALRLCAEYGYVLNGLLAGFVRGLVAAGRGEYELVDRFAEQLQFSASRNLGTHAVYAAHLRCLAALGASAFDDAYRHAATVAPPGEFRPYNPHAVWLVLDLTEAAARGGRLADAAAHATAAYTSGLPNISSRQRMLCAAALAVATPPEARALFEEALAVPDTERWVFDRARVELLYGEYLRRERATTAARTHLSAALAGFTALRAAPWIARVETELRATGDGRKAPRTTPLTPREQTIAELAATGLTNSQIGAQLFLSERTVSTHLHHVFGKLGVGRRSALRDALRQRTDPTTR
ncbi:helix-turn-helix transcriptional regulator [Nocardia stercoris]|uniref:Helix-turn-helix transcriptional regulator n=1 Tax=Nocardia stercoris TaxID=2483361 RepID=A0A3M2KWC7_9NOCA|nr:helix-turn-helix transcriptional regulator [Nocardia stercoris]